MDIFSAILIVLGLILFETVSSLDNAVINAQVLSTMSQRGRRWFMVYGFFVAVFLIRGLLPFLIVWAANPSLGPLGAFTAAFSSDPRIHESIESSTPILLLGGGTFLILLFFHWLFLEPKAFGIRGERFIQSKGMWFYAVASVILLVLLWFSFQIRPAMAVGTFVGALSFFITNGFKENAEKAEKGLLSKHARSDINKIIYLEAIDATFSIDGVLGAFAFTLSIPLIILGNGIGAFIVRSLTVRSIDSLKKYKFLKNGAMYSVFFLGCVMLTDSFGFSIPGWVPPIITFLVILYFFYKSKSAVSK
ncbi:MAG: DUF475 domain-containing protein [Candidatus Levyibacteriota bacterium]